MWLSLFCFLLFVGIAFYQSIHGLFSSLIFCVIAIVSTALAFTLYEYVAYEFLVAWKPDIALPIALVACFGLPLVVARLGMDTLIQRTPLLPSLVDRAGGLFLGVLTSLLCVGVMTLAVQMLPFGGSFLKFSRFARPPGTGDEVDADALMQAADRAQAGDDNRVLLSPDRFAVGFASMLSDGLFSGQRSWHRDHPDLAVEIGWSQMVPAGVGVLAKPGSASVEPLRITDYVYAKSGGTRSDPVVDYAPHSPKPNHAFWVVTLRPEAGAADSDSTHRFTPSQIRMVGTDRYGDPAQLIPCAVRDSEDTAKHVREFRQGRNIRSVLFQLWSPGPDGNIEVVFEVPQEFTPSFVAYKTAARTEVRAPTEDAIHLPTPTDQPDDAGATRSGRGHSGDASSSRSGRRSGRKRGSRGSRSQSKSGGGRVTGARAQASESFFGDQLPLTVTDYQAGANVDVNSTKEALREGSFHALVAVQGTPGSRPSISRFAVPADKRLLQLNVQNLKARSTLGKALSFATKTLRNYIVTDDAGQPHEMVGQYALANVDGDEMIEVQYYPEQIGSIGRGVRPFSKIKERHLNQRGTRIFYLFLIDQGRQAVEFSTGPRKRADLKSQNLVAE